MARVGQGLVALQAQELVGERFAQGFADHVVGFQRVQRFAQGLRQQADAVVAGALGPELLANFVALKREESLAWRAHVSDWERARYATAF